MNLFIDDLAKYLIEEWDRSLGVRDDAKERRSIVQSPDPERIGVLASLHATIRKLTLLAP